MSIVLILQFFLIKMKISVKVFELNILKILGCAHLFQNYKVVLKDFNYMVTLSY